MAGLEDSFRGEFQKIAEAFARKADAFGPLLERALKRDGIRWSRAMVGSFSGPLMLEGGKARSAALASRQGAGGLRGSFFQRVQQTKGGSRFTLVKGSTSRYAPTHELGTVGAGGELPDIVPKRAKALTIPLKAAMTPSGNPRKVKARDWENTFILSLRKGGNTIGYIVRDKGGGELEFLYRLARKVAIPPRLGMLMRHERGRAKTVDEILAAAMEALGA